MTIARNIARSARAINLWCAQIVAEGAQLILYALLNRPPLGRPFGFPHVPLAKRVAIPASISWSYRRAGDCDAESIKSIKYSSNVSVIVSSGWLGGASKYQYFPGRAVI